MSEPGQALATGDERPVNFKKPPVTEVYLMVQAKSDVFPASNVGLLVGTHGTRFPKMQTYPRSDRVVEPLPGKQLKVKVQFSEQLGQRFWLIDEDETRLIQIQADRFVYNWRQLPDQLEYPRYRSVKEGFVNEINLLLSASKIDPATADFVDLCEICYTNVIDVPDTIDVRRDVRRVFRCASQPSLEHVDHLKTEETTFTWTYIIENDQGEFVGRLRVATIGVRSRLTERYAFHTQLIFRGRPEAPTLSSSMEFFDRGHLAIVKTFKAITTQEMHALWEEDR